ncbi:MAG TPA: calcium/sodium antiporter [Alphaproteobacteria bacterium]
MPLVSLGLCLVGLMALLLGAELLTRGGSNLAAQLGVAPIIIGLTVVAVGTSAPELAVGIDAGLQGNGPLAVGNIAGTNIVNLLLILGLSALFEPIAIRMQTLRMDLPVMIVAASTMLLMVMDGNLTHLDGAILITAGVIYTMVVIRMAERESRAVRAAFANEYRTPRNGWRVRRTMVRDTTTLLGGIVIIVVAADWFVDGAVDLARYVGVSDAFIGLTVVAIGTSSPELATTIVSTLKKQRDIAIGNLLGSSIYNIFFILGATCFVVEIPVSPLLKSVDIPIMALVACACLPVFLTGKRVSRGEGGLFVCAYGAYLAYLLIYRT